MTKALDFTKVVKDCTGGNTKIKQSSYLSEGVLPVVDQGQNLVAGYVDDELIKYKGSLPCVIFGDHTCALKYVDFDFALGADGTKVLVPDHEYIDAKYLFYFLNTVHIPDCGYSRHFKYLKRCKIPIISLSKQRELTKILDTADSLRQKRKEQLVLLDDYIKSVFFEMFGDPVKNEKSWSNHELSTLSAKIGSGATPRGGKSSYKNKGIALIRSMNIHDNTFKYNGLAYIDDTQAENLRNVIVQENDVLFNITGASVCRCAIVPKEILPARVNQHVAIIRPNEKVNSVYLSLLLTSGSFKNFLLRLAIAGGATREAITKEDLGKLSIPVPPIDLQNKFALIVKQVDQAKQKMRASLDEMDNQFNALMQRWFLE